MKKQPQSELELVGLITKIQEQLAALDKKVDTLISRAQSKPLDVTPSPKPFQQPGDPRAQPRDRQENRFRNRVMHKVICADCKKECEVPFKPSGDRPVYCKECFSRRKTSNSFKVIVENKAIEKAPAQEAAIDKPQVSEKKKPASSKKISKKKEPVSKKIKSKK